MLEKGQAVLQLAGKLAKVREARQYLLDARVRLIEAQSDVTGLQARNSDITERLEQKKQDIAALDRASTAVRDEAMKIKEKIQNMLDANSNEEVGPFSDMANGKTPEDLENEIGAEEARLELIHGVDPAVLRQFEKRALDIQNQTKRKEELSNKLDYVTRQIDKLMQKWEPKVDEVVSRINDAFSYNFEQINCAGEVGIHKDEDFEQWAVEIKVKFRYATPPP